ncbi:AAA family ATPase [Ruminiclostridium cellobioparum]|uniref:AAA family ATPase n=1 Tax=Ruminiclostridium cellobioparum TaxID=29355 RepID=UPI0028ACA9B0|nr:AAA family ATPase [Ruminiclostridium cellobioparum]
MSNNTVTSINSISNRTGDVNNQQEIDLFAEFEKAEVERHRKFISGNDNIEGQNQGAVILSITGSGASVIKKKSKLKCIDAYSLSKLQLPPIKYIIEDLLSVGLHILAGPPKLGKSWLVLDLAIQVSTGQSMWGKRTTPGSVLYLALEDHQKRLQSRQNLVLNGQPVPKNLYFATEAVPINEGLIEAMEDWVAQQKIANQNPQVIIVDTFQKIRGHTSSDNAYANDYKDAGELKKFADKHEIAVIVVHHTRKQGDQDVFNTISGSTGLTGAADSMFVIKKQGQGSKEAVFHATGRDIEEMELAIKFNDVTHTWDMVSPNASQYIQQKYFASNPVSILINQLLDTNSGEWYGKVSDLDKILFNGISDMDKQANGIPKAPNSLSRFLNNNIKMLEANNIKYIRDTGKNDGSYIQLKQIPPISAEPPQLEEYQGFENELE